MSYTGAETASHFKDLGFSTAKKRWKEGGKIETPKREIKDVI